MKSGPVNNPRLNSLTVASVSGVVLAVAAVVDVDAQRAVGACCRERGRELAQKRLVDLHVCWVTEEFEILQKWRRFSAFFSVFQRFLLCVPSLS